MNILFIAYFYPPVAGIGLPGVQRVVRLLRYLPFEKASVLTLKERGYPKEFTFESRTHAISGVSVYRTSTLDFFYALNKIAGHFKKNDEAKQTLPFSVPQNKRKGKNEQDRFITLIKGVLSSLMKFPDFAYAWLVPAVFCGISITLKEKPDVLFATGMPWTSLLIGASIKFFCGKKLIVDFRDPWVGNPYIEKGPFENLLDRIAERFVVQVADIVVANTHHLKKEMIERYPRYSKKIIVLPNSYDPENFTKLANIELNKEKLIVAHAGFLYLGRDPIDMIKALVKLRSLDPALFSTVEFHQIGEIQLTYDLKSLAKKERIEQQIHLISQLDHRKCLGYLAAADVLLLIQPNTATQIPSKIYEYIYLEKPIIAITNATGALGNMIWHYDLGAVFEPGNFCELAIYLQKLAALKRSGHDMSAPYTKRKHLFDARRVTRVLAESIENLK